MCTVSLQKESICAANMTNLSQLNTSLPYFPPSFLPSRISKDWHSKKNSGKQWMHKVKTYAKMRNKKQCWSRVMWILFLPFRGCLRSYRLNQNEVFFFLMMMREVLFSKGSCVPFISGGKSEMRDRHGQLRKVQATATEMDLFTVSG